MSDEKRKQQRLDSLSISYIREDKDGEIVMEGMGRTLNVSEGGILLETSFIINPLHSLHLEIAFEDTLVEFRGRVAHCHEQPPGKIFHTGVSFTDLDDTTKNILNQYISHFNEQGS